MTYACHYPEFLLLLKMILYTYLEKINTQWNDANYDENIIWHRKTWCKCFYESLIRNLMLEIITNNDWYKYIYVSLFTVLYIAVY
jgi:hypothetical protein